jgi:hypothetical protein
MGGELLLAVSGFELVQDAFADARIAAGAGRTAAEEVVFHAPCPAAVTAIDVDHHSDDRCGGDRATERQGKPQRHTKEHPVPPYPQVATCLIRVTA